MFLLNLAPDTHPSQVEHLQQRLDDAYPHASFTLAVHPSTPSLLTLTRWGSERMISGYSFASDLFSEESRVSDLDRTIDKYIAAVHREQEQAHARHADSRF